MKIELGFYVLAAVFLVSETFDGAFDVTLRQGKIMSKKFFL